MQYKAQRMDRYAVSMNTHRSSEYVRTTIAQAKELQDDPQKKERLEKSECLACFYLSGRIGGAAMTERPCGICGKVLMYGSTCTDAVCAECAKKHSLCAHCGSDLELRTQRRKFDWEVPKEPVPERKTTVTLLPLRVLPGKD